MARRSFFATRGLAALGVLAVAASARAEVKPNNLFTDNAVLQRGQILPVWGTARDGETVSVDFAGQHLSTVAHAGKWVVRLNPLAGSDRPADLTIRGDNTVVLKNILVGDVWVAGGQSNMERQLGPRAGQPDIENWQAEVAAANYPAIREYYVPEVLSATPKAEVDGGHWTVCSPQTVKDFTAVGYFFARDLHQATKVPIGILFTAWGGTPAEAWTSAAGLRVMPEFHAVVKALEASAAAAASPADLPTRFAAWYANNDAGSRAGQEWSAPDLATADWASVNLPWTFADNFDGVCWVRKELDLPAAWAGRAATLNLGPIDDMDTAYVNGTQVGHGDDWKSQRHYPVPAGVLKTGRNVISLRTLDTGGVGGLMGGPESYQLTATGPAAPPDVALAGPWLAKIGVELHNAPPVPGGPSAGVQPGTPTVLFNGMIAPLLAFPIKGVVWYQGEANQDRAEQYRTLFPAMIADWRKSWGLGNFPFLFVQIAPFNGMRPEIREAQLLTLQKSPNTAMAVTTDIGEATNIHPRRKAPAGARLALAAEALAYGAKVEYSGPLYQAMKVQGNRALLTFTHTGGGLIAQGGPLKGFVIAGADEKFFPAHAEIASRSVAVWSEQVSQPASVRYGWEFVPDVNLYNQEGLPASPFRTDDGPAPPAR